MGDWHKGVGCSRKPHKRIKGTDAIFFIPHTKVPRTEKVIYPNVICDLRPLKPEKHRVRLIVGGNKLDYEEDTSSPATSLLGTKILLNNVISDADKGSRFCTADLK